MASLEKLGSGILTIFLVLYLVALVFSNYNADEESRILVFKEEVPNKALHGHVIRTEQVLNDGGCRVQCYLEPNCVSINVGPLKDGSLQCDLNDVTDDREFAVVLTRATGFTYNGVENQCRTRPCWNNGTCQAGFTDKDFRCICPVGVRGERCKNDFRVACLKGASKLSTLEDFTGRVKWDNTDEIVMSCANLAEGQQYKLFALGNGGVCLSGKNMTVKYHASDTYNATCNHGIGMEDSMFVYSLEPLPRLKPKGCYVYVSNDRPLADQFANLLDIEQITRRLDQILNQCARVAKDEGYEYFAIHNYRECYGEGGNYTRHRKSAHCLNFANKLGYGVGKENSSFVYKLKYSHDNNNNTNTIKKLVSDYIKIANIAN